MTDAPSARLNGIYKMHVCPNVPFIFGKQPRASDAGGHSDRRIQDARLTIKIELGISQFYFTSFPNVRDP